MRYNRPIVVIDTNILIDYPDIIPDKDGATRILANPVVNLAGAHLVIPSAVVRELSGFKNEPTARGKSARTVLRRLRMFVKTNVHGMDKTYSLEAPVELPDGKLLSILPVHADFKGSLPFRPSEDDMDGQIILATLAAMHLVESTRDTDKGVDWRDSSMRLGITSDNVTLLTNDNGLAIRAAERGIKTHRYSYELPKPYTGRRDLVVPEEVFAEFYKERKLEREIWEMFMPNEEPLVANEFITMRLENPLDYPPNFRPGSDPYFRHIGRYDAEKDAIVGLRYISEAPFEIMSDGQAMYAEALLHPEIAAIICTGPAGSGKTYLPTVYGIDACQLGRYISVVVVPCKDSGKLGALPGDLNEKMALDVGPFRNAIRNYLLNENLSFRKEIERIRKYGARLKLDGDTDDEPQLSLNDKLQARVNLIWRMLFQNIPVEKARGLDFAYELVLYDEFQDQSPSQADMLIKRIGRDGKIVITGDIKQIHSPYLDEYNNGIVYASRELYDSPLVARVSLLKDEVERHELVKMIAERQTKRLWTP